MYKTVAFEKFLGISRLCRPISLLISNVQYCPLTMKITELSNGPEFSYRYPIYFFLLLRPHSSVNSNCHFSLLAADSVITEESLLNKAAKKGLVEE